MGRQAVVGGVVGGLVAVALVLGMVAYDASSRVKPSFDDDGFFFSYVRTCKFESPLVVSLTTVAGLLTFSALLVASIASCISCCSPDHSDAKARAVACGIVCLVFSWLVGLPAVVGMGISASLYTLSGIQSKAHDVDLCSLEKRRHALLGSVLASLLAGVLALAGSLAVLARRSSSSSAYAQHVPVMRVP